MDHRRRIIESSGSGLVPSTYKRVAYILRGTNVVQTSGFNSTGFTIDPTAETKINIGMRATGAQQTSYGYPVACRQTNSDNTIGRGIYVPTNYQSVGMFNGVSAVISGEANVWKDIEAIWYPNGDMKLSDGTTVETITNESPRAIGSELYFFGFKAYNANQNQSPFRGYISYLKITENGILKRDYVPVVRLSDNMAGFYDLVTATFRGNANYTPGEDI